MATLVGGKRDRMIIESVLQSAVGYLTTAGWFGPNRYHSAITVVDEFPDDNTPPEVAQNTLAFSHQFSTGEDLEMGAKTETHFITFFFDFFAENDAVGRHLIGDLYEWAKVNETVPVYDYSDAGDPLEFYVTMDGDMETRKPNATNNWQKHWHVLSFTVSDVRPHS